MDSFLSIQAKKDVLVQYNCHIKDNIDSAKWTNANYLIGDPPLQGILS